MFPNKFFKNLKWCRLYPRAENTKSSACARQIHCARRAVITSIFGRQRHAFRGKSAEAAASAKRDTFATMTGVFAFGKTVVPEFDINFNRHAFIRSAKE